MCDMKAFSRQPSRGFLLTEFAALFIVLPLAVFFHATRMTIALALWGVTFYAGVVLHRRPDFSWRREWRGIRPTKYAALRWGLSTAALLVLTAILLPDSLFTFPARKTVFWLMAMILYPVLSALPQEVLFRSFFFRRYAPLFAGNYLVAASAASFGFVHIVLHNAVAPLLSLICGFFLASSYREGAGLRRVALEHALYGDMVFTVGLGLYFVAGNN